MDKFLLEKKENFLNFINHLPEFHESFDSNLKQQFVLKLSGMEKTSDIVLFLEEIPNKLFEQLKDTEKIQKLLDDNETISRYLNLFDPIREIGGKEYKTSELLEYFKCFYSKLSRIDKAYFCRYMDLFHYCLNLIYKR